MEETTFPHLRLSNASGLDLLPRLLAEEKNLMVARTLSPECESAVVDPDRLELVLSNLFSNAIRHPPAAP